MTKPYSNISRIFRISHLSSGSPSNPKFFPASAHESTSTTQFMAIVRIYYLCLHHSITGTVPEFPEEEFRKKPLSTHLEGCQECTWRLHLYTKVPAGLERPEDEELAAHLPQLPRRSLGTPSLPPRACETWPPSSSSQDSGLQPSFPSPPLLQPH